MSLCSQSNEPDLQAQMCLYFREALQNMLNPLTLVWVTNAAPAHAPAAAPSHAPTSAMSAPLPVALATDPAPPTPVLEKLIQLKAWNRTARDILAMLEVCLSGVCYF